MTKLWRTDNKGCFLKDSKQKTRFWSVNYMLLTNVLTFMSNPIMLLEAREAAEFKTTIPLLLSQPAAECGI